MWRNPFAKTPPRIEPLPVATTPLLARNTKRGIIAILIAMAATYAVEGEFVNHKDDTGGATRYGITEAVAREYGYDGDMINFPKHCDTHNPVCADRIYTDKYIDKPNYRPMAEIAPAVFYEMYDSAVLHGPSRSSRWFQQALNEECHATLEIDGKVGTRTITAYKFCQLLRGPVHACIAVIDNMDKRQEAFFRAIVDRRPSQKVFLKGWLAKRVGNVDRAECGSIE